MMLTQNGKLLYISDNAAEYLGHSMVSVQQYLDILNFFIAKYIYENLYFFVWAYVILSQHDAQSVSYTTKTISTKLTVNSYF